MFLSYYGLTELHSVGFLPQNSSLWSLALLGPVPFFGAELENMYAQSPPLTETIFPSEGMKAGLLLSRSLVCKVLKLISSWHFSWTLGGLCKRR